MHRDWDGLGFFIYPFRFLHSGTILVMNYCTNRANMFDGVLALFWITGHYNQLVKSLRPMNLFPRPGHLKWT